MNGFSDLAGKHVVITGANSGIGLSLLEGMLKRGCIIVAADLGCSNLVHHDPSKVHPVTVDISDREGVDRLFDEAVSFFGHIDIFVANAGFPYYERISHADWDHIERIFSVNTISPIYSYEKMIEHLAGRRGAVVITDSAMGETAMPGFTLYSSTKYALDGFRSGVRFEQPKNIELTFVYPVSTDTGFFHNDTTKGMVKPWPVQTPVDVANDIIRGIVRGAKRVYPSTLYRLSRVLFRICPPIKWSYRRIYQVKMEHHMSRKE